MLNNEYYDPSHPGFNGETQNAIDSLIFELEASSKEKTTSNIGAVQGSYSPEGVAQTIQQPPPQQKKEPSRKRKLASTKTSCTPSKRKQPESSAAANSCPEENKLTYEQMQETVRLLDSSVDQLGNISTRNLLEDKLAADVNKAEQLLRSVIVAVKRKAEEATCHFCKRSPRTNPLIVKGSCGHSFCCLSCLGRYVETIQYKSQGVLRCMRCEATGSITLIQL